MEKSLTSPEEEGISPADGLQAGDVTSASPWFLLPAYAAEFGLAHLHIGMSQFLKIILTQHLDLHILSALFLWRTLTNTCPGMVLLSP